MEFLMSQQLYLILFGVLIVVFTLIIFKMTGASWSGLVASLVISLILTALAFYKTNQAMGQSVIFYLAVGLGAIPFMYFATKSLLGFAAFFVMAVVVLAMYAYSVYPQYGFYVTVGLVALGILAIVLVFLLLRYKVKMQTKVLLGGSVSSGHQPVLLARTNVFAYLKDLSAKYPNTRKRAQYLLSRPEELDMVYESLDKDTLREVERLNR